MNFSYLVLLSLFAIGVCEIHRAKIPKHKLNHGIRLGPRSKFPNDQEFEDYHFQAEELEIEDRLTKQLYDSNVRTVYGHSIEIWLYSITSAVCVGLSGIFPLLIIPLNAEINDSSKSLMRMLSFAVGGLLGDVFLHLLPETWSKQDTYNGTGCWVMCGLLGFFVISKMFPEAHAAEDEVETTDKESSTTSVPEFTNSTLAHSNGVANGTNHTSNGAVHLRVKSNQNGDTHTKIKSTRKKEEIPSEPENTIKVTGWLNLMANVIDNFTHGLAVAASYSTGIKGGILTTFIILLHEVPHEIGDFAILLRSGFDRWKAAKAQLLTASGAVVGAICALFAESAQSAGESTAWVLPFTAGGFIYIALVTVVPDLLQETDPKESFLHVVFLILGILVMAFAGLYLEEHDLEFSTDVL